MFPSLGLMEKPGCGPGAAACAHLATAKTDNIESKPNREKTRAERWRKETQF